MLGKNDNRPQEELARLAAEVRQLQFDVEELKRNQRKLQHVGQALWRLLREQAADLDEGALQALANRLEAEADAEDEAESLCQSCGRRLPKRGPACLYCGTKIERGPFET